MHGAVHDLSATSEGYLMTQEATVCICLVAFNKPIATWAGIGMSDDTTNTSTKRVRINSALYVHNKGGNNQFVCQNLVMSLKSLVTTMRQPL